MAYIRNNTERYRKTERENNSDRQSTANEQLTKCTEIEIRKRGYKNLSKEDENGGRKTHQEGAKAHKHASRHQPKCPLTPLPWRSSCTDNGKPVPGRSDRTRTLVVTFLQCPSIPSISTFDQPLY